MLIVITYKHCTGFQFHNPYICKICFPKTTSYCYLQLRCSISLLPLQGHKKLSGAAWDRSAVERCSAVLAISVSALQEAGRGGRETGSCVNSSGAGRGRLPPRCSDGRCVRVRGVLFSLLLQEPVEGGTAAGEGRAWDGSRKSVYRALQAA